MSVVDGLVEGGPEVAHEVGRAGHRATDLAEQDADELHCGRTAARLCLSPARVTQAVQKQERQIGAALFERGNRTVRLTQVGRRLRDDLRPVYAGLKESVERARLAGQGVTGTLRVGMLPLNAHDLSSACVTRGDGCASTARRWARRFPRCAAATRTSW
ncbi:LysR family transcriptional regulator [Nonomuraea sp. NPDC004580]|uniref:LysR family transcriptional regulator n=1 Tax=Nonomuraea sp. NPDC004580 TaxID=3154552 RepID=UPI0033A8B1EC